MAADGGWGWVVVVGCCICHFFLIGINRSMGIIYVVLQERFEASATDTALAASIFVSVRAFGGKSLHKRFDGYVFRMKFPTGFTYRNLLGFARFPGDSTALVVISTYCRSSQQHNRLFIAPWAQPRWPYAIFTTVYNPLAARWLLLQPIRRFALQVGGASPLGYQCSLASLQSSIATAINKCC